MYMDKNRKNTLGVVSIIPLLLLIFTLIYEDSILDGLFSTGYHHEANAVVSDNYNSLALLYGIVAALAIILLLYFIVHVARLKQMKSGRKILWISALTLLLPVSFPLFWYFVINKEPKMLDTKDDIS